MRVKIIYNFIIRDLKIISSYKTSFFGRIIGAVVLLTIFYFISITVKYKKYFPYLLVGLSYAAIIRSSLYHLSNKIEKEQSEGTVGYLFTNPFNTAEYLVGNSISGFISSWIEALIFLMAGIIIFGAPITLTSMNIITLIFIVLIGTLSMWGIGIISASITLLIKKGLPITWLITVGVMLGGNVFFPARLLPGWLKWTTHINPASHTLKILRSVLIQRNEQAIFGNYVLLLIFSFIYIWLGFLCFNKVLERVKKKGTLEHL